MQQDIPVCPGCGAGIQSAAPSAATPACQYCGWHPPESRPPSGANHFRQLLAEQANNSEDLLDQVPEDLREILAGRRMGGPPAALSPSDVVKLAAELEGGVKPRGQLPVCPKCQGLSPIGQAKCQWCGEPLPSKPGP
jgi:hypothetical protein